MKLYTYTSDKNILYCFVCLACCIVVTVTWFKPSQFGILCHSVQSLFKRFLYDLVLDNKLFFTFIRVKHVKEITTALKKPDLVSFTSIATETAGGKSSKKES